MRIAFSVIFVFVLCSCSYQKQISDLEESVKGQNKKIVALEKDIQSIFVQLDNLSSLSDLPNKSLKDNYMRLSGQLNEMQKQLNSLKEEINRRKRISESPQNATALKKSPSPRKTPVPEGNKGNAKALYQKGLKAYEDRNLSESVKYLREFLKKYPAHKLAANSQYWLGECYYSLENYEYAKNEFQKVIDFFPGSSKVPDSHVKIALIYKKNGQNEQAVIELSRILKRYPAYERRELVEYLLKELKQE
ncbi:MAG: tol-pal system protein YbgF [Candidatus Cloacimonadota bacterium]|nr:MAG: tol-pal system protein YbgF [Candidatus Cloacimonadota bacterium]